MAIRSKDERRARRPGVTSAHGQPGERHGFGGPCHRDCRRSQLHEGRDREEGDTGSGDEVAEQVVRPLAEQEPAADEEVGERGKSNCEAAPGVQAAVEDHEDAPEQECGVGKNEDRARRPEVVTPDAHLLAGRGNDVDEPEAGQRDDRLGRVRVARQPARQLRGRQHEGQGREPAPRAEERHRRRAHQRDGDEQERQERGRRAHERRCDQRGDEPEGSDAPRVVPDGDDRCRDRGDERAGETGLGRKQAVQSRGREQRNGYDAQANASEDVAHQRVPPGQQDRSGGERDRPAASPIATRIGSVIQPRLKARLRKKMAAATRAMPPTHASARPANRSSRSFRDIGVQATVADHASESEADVGGMTGTDRPWVGGGTTGGTSGTEGAIAASGAGARAGSLDEGGLGGGTGGNGRVLVSTGASLRAPACAPSSSIASRRSRWRTRRSSESIL